MCLIGDVFDDDELNALSKKKKEVLQEYGKLLALTDREIRDIIKHNKEIQQKLHDKLEPELKRLKKI